jgi:hypothetical protein
MAQIDALLVLAGFLCAAPPDLSRVDRTITKEPAYRAAPRYCLLVFGPEADVRVWLVRDGDTLYVDRNANGNLTEAGESLRVTRRREVQTVHGGKSVPYREMSFDAGNLTPAGKGATHTGLSLTQYQFGDDPAEDVLSIVVNGTTKQYAGWGALFADTRDRAPVLHFGGPLKPAYLRREAFSLSEPDPELSVCFGTKGFGQPSFSYLAYEAVPANIHPQAEIEWPADGPDARPVRTTATLSHRC